MKISTPYRHRPALLLPLLVLLLAAACARQGAPPGGPVDRKPPRIMATAPRPDTTRVPLDSRIFLHFNESVEHRSCEESIFITPQPAEKPRYKWHGRKLEIILPGGLLPQRTYVITVGTGTRDLRNIAMASSYSLAFSTGDSLDRGALAGKILCEGQAEGVQLWAYELGGGEPNPAQTPPLYVTQANSLGEFALEYLALGAYRLFAVGDRDRNNRYDAEREIIGIASRDYLLTSGRPRIDGLLLRAALQDTTPPALAGASALDARHLDLRFSEHMAERRLANPANYRITTGGDTLAVLDLFIDKRNPAYLHLLTAEQQAEAAYTVTVGEGWDLAGHPLADTSRTAAFTGSARADSAKPYFIASRPEDKARNVPLDAAITLAFSEAMDQPLAGLAFALSDTGRTPLPGRITWLSSAEMEFRPDSLLRPDRLYTVRMAVDSLRDRQGNPLADTLLTIRFQTLNPDTLSEIAGALRDAAPGRSGPFFITARVPKGAAYEITAAQEGAWRFEKIMPGEYLIDFFRDEDGDGRFSPGRPFPWQPAERYTLYPDTIRVRSRWPNEGNDLLLPE